MKHPDPCLRQFAGACVNALRMGHRTYYLRQMTVLREENSLLYELLDRAIRRFSFVNTHNMDELYLCMVLFLEGVWPVPEIDLSTAQQIADTLFAGDAGREAIAGSGEDYLVTLFLKMYNAYSRFVDTLADVDPTFAHDARFLAQIIGAAIQRQLSNRSILYQVGTLGINVG
ncbi:MAG: hypothetical protein PHY34_02315 [Patescibacteria group bacterium]|nr:hypothetical protein [Patescibacteria group bacterium]MDD5715231.1 hypothetical protein [Patescibacteria group bacterium]